MRIYVTGKKVHILVVLVIYYEKITIYDIFEIITATSKTCY